MEFIQGESPLKYAKAHELNTRQRLDLMAKVCEAVHHVHQRFIIHRDLKPGNIVVDHSGQPKVLDFGVARVTDSDAEATRQTDVGHLVGTLAYMSPEQVVADPLELDTRSDVYALGVILYELLAGRLPYAVSRNLPEAVQTIRDEEPAPLSSISRHYRGDIETIVAKALEKDKTRRYASAAGLSGDIRRYLTDEPIVARPPSVTYQLQKFARRHRALVSGAAAAFLVLIAGIAISTWEARRATRAGQAAIVERDRATQERERALSAEQTATKDRNRAVAAEARAVQERDRAVTEKQRADNESATAKAVNDFLQDDLLAQAGSRTQALSNFRADPDLKVRTALDRAAGRIAGKFDKQPLVEAAIRRTIGNAYYELGLYPAAQRQLERALDLQRRLLGEGHPGTLEGLSRLAVVHAAQARYAQAEPIYTKVLEAQRRVLGEEHSNTLETMFRLAQMYLAQASYAKAEPLYTKALEAQRRSLGKEHPDTLNSMHDLAYVYLWEGKFAQSETLLTQALQAMRRVLGEEHPDTLVSMQHLAILYVQQGKYSQAEPISSKALEIERRVLGEEHPQTIESMGSLALLYRREGKYPQAEVLSSKVLEIERRVLGEEHPTTLTVMNNLAVVYQNQGRYTEAEVLQTKALEIQRRVLGEERPDTLLSMNNLGMLYVSQGKYSQAEPLLTKTLEVRHRLLGEEHPDTLVSMNNLAGVYQGQGKSAHAESLWTKVLEVRRRVLGEEHPSTLITVNSLAALYQGQGRYAEAEQLYTKLVDARRRVLGPQHADTASALNSLGGVLVQQHKYAEAEPVVREVLANYEMAMPDAWPRFNSQSILGSSLAGEKKYDAAEALLLSGYEGMQQRQATIPAASRFWLEQAGKWIVQLYQEWGKPEQATVWTQRLRKTELSVPSKQ